MNDFIMIFVIEKNRDTHEKTIDIYNLEEHYRQNSQEKVVLIKMIKGKIKDMTTITFKKCPINNNLNRPLMPLAQ